MQTNNLGQIELFEIELFDHWLGVNKWCLIDLLDIETIFSIT